MTRKIYNKVFLFLLILLILILFSPLDYVNLIYTFIHLWITIIYGFFILIKFSETKQIRKKRIIASSIISPFFGFISLYVYVALPHNAVVVSSVPNSNLIVTSQYYTMFMVGNPTVDINVGYPIFGKHLIWKTNSYRKGGEGEADYIINSYNLPFDNYKDGYDLFILTEDNLLLDRNKNVVYRVTRKF